MSTLTFNGLIKITFTGNNGTGGISVPGLKVGDIVLTILQSDNSIAEDISNFETSISVDDEIQQSSSSNYTSYSFTAVLARVS